jgi:hypothetical protein
LSFSATQTSLLLTRVFAVMVNLLVLMAGDQ